RGVALPAMVERGGEEAVEVVGQVLLELLARHRGLRRGLQKYARFEFGRRLGRHVGAALDDCVADFAEKLVADGAAHGVFGEGAACVAFERAVQVVRQTIFKLCAKHLNSLHPFHSLFFGTGRPKARSPFAPSDDRSRPYLSNVAHRDHPHAPENLRKLDATAVDSRFDRPFGNLQEVDDLLVAQLLYVAQYDAGAKVWRKLVNAGLHLLAQLAPLQFALRRVAGGAKVVRVALYVLCVRVLRRALAAS